tara:strand:- start:3302 stop:3499 length:198 start_codon:yes stop_codon:yes gene_type:complete
MARYDLECVKCGGEQAIEAKVEDVNSWRDGVLIQNAMPYLSADEREMFISGICPICWEKIFGEES